MQPAARKLALFPHLADADFDQACSAMLQKFQRHGHRQSEWAAVDRLCQHEATVLRITKALPLHPSEPDASSETEERELAEDDDEVAQTRTSPAAAVHYDVVLSASYRVPVLYFTVVDAHQHRYPLTAETLHACVMPPACRAQAEHGGVLGGVTVTDHPATNQPAFFVHPCRTAQVIEASASGRDLTAYGYLVLWMGALGQCVGLNVPMALVTQDLEVKQAPL
ncbi:uncharacterized protein EKO05_0008102 [Ascochyta rabiei]|uniref:Ubiquitin-like-conjugating enzyme ATG10 n=1 Tax=Didymella rabiei TaxID=5454 RepID=A0A163AD23_DIDRA|nr:uncharacterized protein EKO05_0008102 [Ascochyta rabiei]KZM21125.1 hypothetical protein ST47_g7725 [Ascochyta rabiei]UPX17763.1 hypothetical protein EKO05_0008102 [Ascochyta rabiei]